jgi:hypothetical protein
MGRYGFVRESQAHFPLSEVKHIRGSKSPLTIIESGISKKKKHRTNW